MYFDYIQEEYLPAIATLEKEMYPEEFLFGINGLKEELKKSWRMQSSWAVFRHGVLQGYILAYHENGDIPTTYISDLACRDIKCLKLLLLKFFYENQYTKRFHAHMRSTSYNMFRRQLEKNKNAISIITEHVLEDYYDNEEAYEIYFTVRYTELIKDWRIQFLLEFYSTPKYNSSNLMNSIFLLLRKPMENGVNLIDDKNFRFVMNSIKEYILDHYQMFDDKIPMKIEYEIPIGDNEDKVKKVIYSLEKKGYKERGQNKYFCFDGRGILHIVQQLTAWNTDYKDSLSGFRWFQRKEQKWIRTLKNISYVSYYNKFGVYQDIFPVPYFTRQRYLYYLNKNQLIINIIGNLHSEACCETEDIEILVNNIFYLLSSKNAKRCIDNIVNRYSSDVSNYFHDWNIIISELIESKHILTEGAIVAILCCSYNKALKLYKQITVIWENILNNKRLTTLISIKEIRKRISYLLRYNEDCSEFVNYLQEIVLKDFLERKKLSKNDWPLFEDYILRMQRYCSYITLPSLYHTFGKELFRFVKGESPCIFKPAVVTPSFQLLAKDLKLFLKGRSKAAKHVYKKLHKEDLLIPVMTENLETTQVSRILQILNYHNVKLRKEEYENLEKFQCVIERKCSPEFLIAGDATVCCMSYGSEKAYTYAMEEGFGIINVYYKNRIIANSLIWINEPYNCLVLDNIEVHPNYVKYGKQLKNCFRTATTFLLENYKLHFAVQGKRYNDLLLYNENDKEIYFKRLEPIKGNGKEFYTDAAVSILVESKVKVAEVDFILEKGAEEFLCLFFIASTGVASFLRGQVLNPLGSRMDNRGQDLLRFVK